MYYNALRLGPWGVLALVRGLFNNSGKLSARARWSLEWAGELHCFLPVCFLQQLCSMSLPVGNIPRTQYMEAERGEMKLVLLMLLLRRLFIWSIWSQEWCVCAHKLGSLGLHFRSCISWINQVFVTPLSQHPLMLLIGCSKCTSSCGLFAVALHISSASPQLCH